ncbi:hypothetical protein AeNC1_016470 [Aphanomyces euteiches]|nr:hypothetical protein AeNC1_016470 [Aphanomyces euteiches]
MSDVHLRAVEWLNLPIDRGKFTKINGLGSNSIRTLGTVPVKLAIGNGIATEEMESQLAFIPEITPGPTSIHVDDLDFGEPDQPDEERAKMKAVLVKYMPFFIQSGNGLPPAARGAVCDIDVGNARPIAQRARRVRPEHLKQLFELLKGLLEYGLITFSKSPWASPIVIVLKKVARTSVFALIIELSTTCSLYFCHQCRH